MFWFETNKRQGGIKLKTANILYACFKASSLWGFTQCALGHTCPIQALRTLTNQGLFIKFLIQRITYLDSKIHCSWKLWTIVITHSSLNSCLSLRN